MKYSCLQIHPADLHSATKGPRAHSHLSVYTQLSTYSQLSAYPHLSVQDVRRLLACDGLRGRDQSGAVGAHGLDGQTLPSEVRSPAGTRFDKLSSRRRKFSSLPCKVTTIFLGHC